MFTPKALLMAAIGALAAALAGAASAQQHGPGSGPGLGIPVTEADLAALDTSILPDGTGLPPGSGDAVRGAQVYAQQCALCHGEAGAGGVQGMPALTGGIGTLADPAPVKTVNSYWPYATGIFDYVRRAMSPLAPQTLGADDLYAVTAYILSVDGVVAPDATMDARTLPQVRMPNRDGFVMAQPQWSGE